MSESGVGEWSTLLGWEHHLESVVCAPHDMNPENVTKGIVLAVSDTCFCQEVALSSCCKDSVSDVHCLQAVAVS